MATSDVEICNLALTRLGQASISSLSEGSNEANKCKLLFTRSRNAVLRAHPWSFAEKVQALSLTVNTPVGWSFEYDVPADALRVIEVVKPSTHTSPIPFQLRAGKVLTDHEDAQLKYTREVTDPNDFDEHFIETLAYKMAVDLALALTGKESILQDMKRLYMQALAIAEAGDAREARLPPPYGKSYLESRS